MATKDTTSSLINSRQGTLKQIKTLMGFYVLIVLIIELLIVISLFTPASVISKEIKPYLLGAGISIILSVVILVTILAIKYPGILTGNYVEKDTIVLPQDGHIEQIIGRSELYKKATQMISNASRIYDTTWGRSPRDMTKREKEARDEYRNALKLAIQRGAEYFDLFSKTQNQLKELKASVAKFINHPQYEAKCLTGMDEELPVIDFLITDNSEILLSHVAHKGAISIPTYIYVKSKTVSDFYSGLFNECWNKADKIQPEK